MKKRSTVGPRHEDMKKLFIGDGVYVDFIDGRLVLTTENGQSTTNTIVLEAEVYNQLLLCVRALKRQGAADEYNA